MWSNDWELDLLYISLIFLAFTGGGGLLMLGRAVLIDANRKYEEWTLHREMAEMDKAIELERLTGLPDVTAGENGSEI